MGRIKRYIQMLMIFLRKGGYSRAEYLKKIHYFKNQGEHCCCQQWNYGTEPYLISLGDNVTVSSSVRFVNHDGIYKMFKFIDDTNDYIFRTGEINIGNNVYIGFNSTILYDVTIGNNVIIGACTLVNKNIPDGVIVAGNPCRIVGYTDQYMNKLRA